ncbi:Uncharacterized protein AC499_1395 [Pseudomonas amygdali pv. lachrymans]|uniref:Uncharacterized protein n=1 Tax=Pseudomonas amygdali pv. lachrymans TaxID=53707 RepID=A0ABR5KS50_PSEAV|nr:Uncharacterized protein AC499_0436 [Pseudomonas amygdali pv. lachrymans]KPC18193.1 Uncharacterized protein AC499_1395 [Pseudomonas amygdali pv. lachrymans]
MPMKHRLNEELEQLVVVTNPIDAQLKGKSYFTSEGKRFPEEFIMKVKSLAMGMLPDYYVICHPGDLDEAVALLHAAILKHLAPVLNYYDVVSRAAKNPLLVKTKDEFMADLMKPKPKVDQEAT